MKGNGRSCPVAGRAFVGVLSVGWVLLGGVGPLVGAEDPDPDFSLEETVRLGPFHVAPFLVIKDFGYDDNVRLNALEQTGDYTMTIGPGARAVVPMGRRTALALWDETDFALFAEESDLNHVNNTFRSKLHVYLSDVTLFFDGERESYRERPNSEIDFRIRRNSQDARLGLSYRPARRLQTSFYVDRAAFRYDSGSVDAGDSDLEDDLLEARGEVIAEDLDRDETRVGMEGRVRIRPRTTFLLEVSRGGIDFDRAEPERDSSTTETLAGFEFDPAGSLQGTLKAGLKRLDPEEDSQDGFSGLVADSEIALRFLGRATVKARYGRDTGFSTLGDNLFFISETRGLSYEHFINSQWSFDLGRDLVGVEYPEEVSNPDTCRQDPMNPDSFLCEEEQRLDDIVADTVAVRYRTGPTLRLGLAYSRWDRDSTFDTEDTTRNTVYVVMEYTP